MADESLRAAKPMVKDFDVIFVELGDNFEFVGRGRHELEAQVVLKRGEVLP